MATWAAADSFLFFFLFFCKKSAEILWGKKYRKMKKTFPVCTYITDLALHRKHSFFLRGAYLPLVLLPNVVLFRHVDEVNHGFGRDH